MDMLWPRKHRLVSLWFEQSGSKKTSKNKISKCSSSARHIIYDYPMEPAEWSEMQIFLYLLALSTFSNLTSLFGITFYEDLCFVKSNFSSNTRLTVE